MAYDIFHGYGLDKIHDSLTENYDYKDNDAAQWELVKVKPVMDLDGFHTEYAWYTNGDKHIFMFGDTDMYEPDEDYADWVAETEKEATDWFDSYNGFSEEEFDEAYLESYDEYNGNADFLNDGFERIYGIEGDLEE